MINNKFEIIKTNVRKEKIGNLFINPKHIKFNKLEFNHFTDEHYIKNIIVGLNKPIIKCIENIDGTLSLATKTDQNYITLIYMFLNNIVPCYGNVMFSELSSLEQGRFEDIEVNAICLSFDNNQINNIELFKEFKIYN